MGLSRLKKCKRYRGEGARKVGVEGYGYVIEGLRVEGLLVVAPVGGLGVWLSRLTMVCRQLRCLLGMVV